MARPVRRETEIHADPDAPLIRIVREFDAPPERVFEAHADPCAVRAVDPFADRDAFLASGMEIGVREGYDTRMTCLLPEWSLRVRVRCSSRTRRLLRTRVK